MVLPLVPQVQATVSADETIGLVQHLRGNRESQGFCAFGLNEQTRTPNAGGEPPPTAGAQRTLLVVGSSALFGADSAHKTRHSGSCASEPRFSPLTDSLLASGFPVGATWTLP